MISAHIGEFSILATAGQRLWVTDPFQRASKILSQVWPHVRYCDMPTRPGAAYHTMCQTEQHASSMLS